MHPLALFNLSPAELAILGFFGLFLLVAPVTAAIVLWAVFRSRRKDMKGNE